MTQTSLFVALFKRLGEWWKTSIIAAFFGVIGSFFAGVLKTFKESVTSRFLCGVADSVANAYSGSKLHGVLTTEDIENRAGTSVFYRLYSWIINAVTGMCSAAMRVLVDFSKASVVHRAFAHDVEKENSRAYLGLFGFIIAFMFCVPHSFWNNLLGLAVAVAAFALVIYGNATNKKNVIIRPDRTYFTLLLFFACLTLSMIISRNIGDSIRIYMFFITSFLLCVSVGMFASTKEAFRSICVMLTFCVTVTGLVGIVQAILKVEADASLTDLTLNADMPGRVFSTMGNPNNFAQMLVLFLPFCMAFALTRKSIAKRFFLCALMVIPFVALLQTYSRSGWIAFAVAAAVFVALSNRRAVPFLIVVCVIAVPFLPESILNRILTIGNLKDSSSSYRLVIWSGAFEMLSDWWKTGVGIGPGAFKSVYPAYAQGTTWDVAHCHMQFLEVFLETGIIGFISFICMTFTVIKRSFLASSSEDREIKYYGAASAASMTSIIFIGFFEYYWFYPRVMFSFFISAGLAIAAYRMRCDAKEKNN